MADQATRSITVGAPLTEVFEAWSNFENFPHFMKHVKSVTRQGDGSTHWVADGPLGKNVEWDAETTMFEPNKRIGWHSKDGSPIKTSGQVTFVELGTGQTQVNVTMQWSVPASKGDLKTLSANLRERKANQHAWQAVLALKGRTAFADRAIALRNYNRAVGLRTLVRGLVASKSALQHRVLTDRRITIYAGGRSDIASGREDVRILALLRYLAVTHGQVTVSCLFTGHGLYARPGVVSAHIYGEAADISALGGVSIYGHQQPGGVTEKAVRNILLLPAELRPRQVISLLGLGGPSFALANHYDHIHVGF